ncbi:MAG: long-chain-fatty-acid--CoA ligase [Dehalococcoidia bacterium]|nr:long-chain-fatty-acid--CoA ligase [Dehalococcoidia bacterium]
MNVLGDIPRRWSQFEPDKECMVCYSYGEVRYNYKEFNERINRVANSLLGIGLKRGDHVAILMENCHRYAELYYAMYKTGLIPVPLNLRLHPKELQYITDHSDSVGLIIGPEFKDLAASLKPEVKKVKHYISAVERVEGMECYEDFVEKGSPEEPGIEVDENDDAMLIYTGGTTGLPKGAVLTHRNFMNWLTDSVVNSTINITPGRTGFTPEDSTLFILPAFHISFWPILLYHFLGNKVVMVRRPDLTQILQTIEKERITHMNAVPTVYFWLVKHPDVKKYDLSSVKGFSYAGAPFPTEVLKECAEVFGPIFGSGYGATEGGPWTSLPPKDHVWEGPEKLVRRLKSVGRPSMLCDVRIVDEEGRDVSLGEVGEVIVKTKSTMKEYWKDPEKTKQVKKGDWYHTGDLGAFDENGYVYLHDRMADMIKSGAERVYPIEVENVLHKHPAVSEVTVIGVPDPEWGERVVAIVYLDPEHAEKYKGKEENLKTELKDFCHQELAGYKCPKTIDFSAEPLPKSAIGKLTRKELKQEYRKSS